MAKQITEWSPDTCGCVILYEVVDGIRKFNKTIKACSAHAAYANKSEHLTRLEDECQLKNYVAGHLAKDLNIELNTFAENYSYMFDANRKLVISHPEIKDKASARAKIDTKFGTGKVEIV
jgi:hypothetical protein